MSTNPQADFFDSINLNNVSIAEIVKSHKLWKIRGAESVYDQLTKICAINLKENLFDGFGSEARIESVITDEALEPYFKNHHVSTLVPSLNIESEAALSEKPHPTSNQ